MELSLQNISKIPKEIATRSLWIQPVPDSFNLYFILFYIVNFLILQLWIYADRVCNKYWPKPKNFMIVDKKISSRKNEMSYFVLRSNFVRSYPTSKLINSFVPSALFLYPLEISDHFWCFQGVEKGCTGKKWVKVP